MPNRTLVAILVHNGRAFVPACLDSAARQAGADVLILDDASPEPGWSEELEALCLSRGFDYYRSPRNLGIPRNMNLALLRARDDYEYVLISNSDVIFPSNLLEVLVSVAETDPRIGSVTAWSNNVAIYSLPNQDPSANLAEPKAVDWVSAALRGEFGSSCIDVPAAVGFCMLIPTSMISKVGLLDPVFGRGYCEEVDWSLRSLKLGLRVVLAPGVFVYHMGQASTRSAGILEPDQTTVMSNERIVHLRHPGFPDQVGDFLSSGKLESIRERAASAIIASAAREHGYSIEASWFPRPMGGQDRKARFVVSPDGIDPVVSASYLGFSTDLAVKGRILAAVEAFAGQPPREAGIFDRGRFADEVAQDASVAQIPIEDSRAYPQRV